MMNRIAQFALATGNARRSARSNFPVEFARPTIEERVVRALTRR